MKLIENIDVLIFEPSDIIERFRSDFDVANIITYFKSGTMEKVFTANLVLFIDHDGTTTILKNRYGKDQI